MQQEIHKHTKQIKQIVFLAFRPINNKREVHMYQYP